MDKANCFRKYNDGTSYALYDDTEQTTVSKGVSSGVSAGVGGILGVGTLGGLSVNSGSSRSTATSYSQQRIIAIPPHGNRNLTEEKISALKVRRNSMLPYDFKILERAEYFDYIWLRHENIAFPKPKDMQENSFILEKNIVGNGEMKEYDENNTPYVREYVINYSLQNDFGTYSSLNAKLFLREIIGFDGHKEKKMKINGEIRRRPITDLIDGIDDYTIEGLYFVGKRYIWRLP